MNGKSRLVIAAFIVLLGALLASSYQIASIDSRLASLEQHMQTSLASSKHLASAHGKIDRIVQMQSESFIDTAAARFDVAALRSEVSSLSVRIDQIGSRLQLTSPDPLGPAMVTQPASEAALALESRAGFLPGETGTLTGAGNEARQKLSPSGSLAYRKMPGVQSR